MPAGRLLREIEGAAGGRAEAEPSTVRDGVAADFGDHLVAARCALVPCAVPSRLPLCLSPIGVGRLMKSSNPVFMNGVPELLVLRLLRSREMYGYEIVQAIRDETRDAISLGEGVVYPLLHALEREGSLTTRRTVVNGRNRIYYTLAPQGASRLGELISTWSQLTEVLRHVISGDDYAERV